MTKVIGGKIPPKEHSKLKVEDRISRMLDRTMFAKTIISPGVRKEYNFAPKDMGPLWLDIPGEDVIYNHPDEVNHPELVWPIDFGCIWPSVDDDGELDREVLQCNRLRSVAGKDIRGKLVVFGTHNLEWSVARLEPDLSFRGLKSYATWIGGKWRHNRENCVHDPRRGFDADDKAFGGKFSMLQSIALNYRYEWGAQFWFPGSPKIVFPTTPEGILSLFNDRDKPEDRDRRAALRHWVNGHLRRIKDPKKNFTDVRGHLRGQLDFSWRGFNVRVVPSQYDIDRSRGNDLK